MQTIYTLRQRYQQIRTISESICTPLITEDYQVQSILETSPPKWHLAHVSWFFETFLLIPNLLQYQVFNPHYKLLFNSYYETLGKFHPRAKRGLLARPSVKEIYAYRHHIDTAMDALFEQLMQQPDVKLFAFIELGLNHEQQHQELLLMDIKHNFAVNPLKPAYREDLAHHKIEKTDEIQWQAHQAGVYQIGYTGKEFAYDNESPQHSQYLEGFQIANRLVTNGEYLAFIVDQGYQRVEWWLADAWAYLKQHQWRHPLYWQQDGVNWLEMTLGGLIKLNLHDPVCHISYYEADAYARWAKARLPTEAELELALSKHPISGNFLEQDYLHPKAAGELGQWQGDLWTWSCSSYQAYPGFKPLAGSAGEYNGKFMSNQMVLRGGSCVTSQNHLRHSYRNFFYPHDRWQFSGIRLATNASI